MKSNAAPVLAVEDVRFGYRGHPLVVDGVSLQLTPGSLHCLIGRSGCGKSTLLKICAGLHLPQAGGVIFNDQTITAPAQEMGFVFQSPTLLSWLNVMDNVLLPISLHGAVTQAHRLKARQLLQNMGLIGVKGLEGLETRSPTQLSGGQQSRVAIARALMTEPKILFMDEPFSALDAITREELHNDFLSLCRQAQTAVLFVTHDIAEAVFLGDKVSVMNEGKIKTEQEVTFAHPRPPSLRYSAEFNAQCAELKKAMELTAEAVL
jgi:NitT/TauT family transport system ATP-binding protein